MTGTIKMCDECRQESRQMNGELATHPTYDWLELKRGASDSTDGISGGVYHFCSEKCLKSWVCDHAHAPNSVLSDKPAKPSDANAVDKTT
jgi:YHS domain-containing protein